MGRLTLADIGAWVEIASGGFTAFLAWLLWASGYTGLLWNAAKKHKWRSPPLDDCTALNLF